MVHVHVHVQWCILLVINHFSVNAFFVTLRFENKIPCTALMDVDYYIYYKCTHLTCMLHLLLVPVI